MVNLDDCMLFAGFLNKHGYGLITFSPQVYGHSTKQVHTVFYEEFVGAIPKGLEIDHLCKIRCCINPDHLEAVTHAENMRRLYGGKCKQGHSFENNEYWSTSPIGTRSRSCKACSARRSAERYKRLKDERKSDV